MEAESKSSSSEASFCCRKQLDANLRSFLFGADIAGIVIIQLLSLCLIGFLDSRSVNDVDEAFNRPIRHLQTRFRYSIMNPIGTCFSTDSDRHGAHSTRKSHKRGRFETSCPRNETVSSPSSNSQVHDGVAGNSVVTANTFSEMIAQQKKMSCSSFLGIHGSDSTKRCMDVLRGPDGELPEKLRNLEPYLIEHISNEIMNHDPNVRWEDIAGLHHAKKCVTEMVIWPLLRPDIFKGCRSPGRGLLLFGPPGTGKTMIGKAIAGEAKATFFYVSASSLVSKWMGEGEKLVRALFGVASCRQPAVIFVDEIDSLLSQRKSDGATNRPQELDEAARRRLTKRLYIPLPSSEARAWIVRNLLEKDGLFKLSTEDIDSICKLTEGYLGSDMKNLVNDASMGPLREAFRQGTEITKLKKEDMRAVTLQDFENALQEVRPSVSLDELGTYEDWNNQFGSISPSSMQP
ncbi:hypothetical protein L6452_11036 [Arctium lappa]|uniref:Uncharacterized protein n=1 Tax=Arctium lappa TaxID=4217 RepID=A0ACB9DNU0_ARCLA|nr:hypothetical protein L6452_11036 [Arctium lappa]